MQFPFELFEKYYSLGRPGLTSRLKFHLDSLDFVHAILDKQNQSKSTYAPVR